MRDEVTGNIWRIYFAILGREGSSRAANQEIRNMLLDDYIPVITDIDTRRRNAQNTGDIHTIVRIQNQLTSELFRLASATRERAREAEEALAQAQQRIT
jgi:carbamoylphosphate synthase small subunit